jgi:hypothetical protein
MWHETTRNSLMAALLLALGAHDVPAQGTNPEPASSVELRQIKQFVSVEVQTQGTAEKLGLKSGELTDLTRLTFLNRIPWVALGGSTGDGTDRLNQLGFLTCEVWTVGEAYIVAYHVDCNVGSYLTARTPGSLWNRALLGYGPKEEVADAVRKGLRYIVDEFALSFAKVRAEGGR